MIATQITSLWLVNCVLPLVAIGAVGTLLCLVSFVHARLSGWTALAKNYRMDRAPIGGAIFRSYEVGFMDRMKPWQSGRATLTSQGVHFVSPAPKYLFHPPLMLPWTLLTSMEVESDGFSQLVRLYFEDVTEAGVNVPLPSAAIPTIRALTGRSDFLGEALR